jgi:hypothetical protein
LRNKLATLIGLEEGFAFLVAMDSGETVAMGEGFASESRRLS